ncbi:hypothetical protein ANCCAN_14453 [Ancylostoma caninum]|uniref:Uncharacterized protein n=1 Tax=Ancylostoma caninum TaxID=29170 RepID=A0A368G584_ANCCA|nr:hypothetical protein ANCCAN_14453 [Ancylostoma caninum]
MLAKYGIVFVLLVGVVDAIQLYQEEMKVPGINLGKPELVVQKEISRYAKLYEMRRLNELLSYYPRFARKLKKLEKVYLDRFHSLAPEELSFFLKASVVFFSGDKAPASFPQATYPDFLLSYIVRPLEANEEKKIDTCNDLVVLPEVAQKNLVDRFPYRGRRIQEQCASNGSGW